MNDSIKVFLKYSQASKKISKPFLIQVPKNLPAGTYLISEVKGELIDESCAVEEYLLKREPG